MTIPNEAERWLVAAACCDTVARTARLTDLHEHEAFAALFTDDAELQRPDGSVLRGRAAILSAYRARPADRLTRHLVAGTVVDVVANDEACAASGVLLWRGHQDDPPGPFGRLAHGPAVVGEFDDHLRRGPDGRWRIARRLARFVLHAPAHL
jgi:hypothetical protein